MLPTPFPHMGGGQFTKVFFLKIHEIPGPHRKMFSIPTPLMGSSVNVDYFLLETEENI